MRIKTASFDDLNFLELEDSFGADTARAILRTLEQFEGISEYSVNNLSFEDRFNNVISAMKESIHFQTRH